MAELDKYEVTIRDKRTRARWTMMFQADSFAHAEEQAKDADLQADNEIIKIEKEF